MTSRVQAKGHNIYILLFICFIDNADLTEDTCVIFGVILQINDHYKPVSANMNITTSFQTRQK